MLLRLWELLCVCAIICAKAQWTLAQDNNDLNLLIETSSRDIAMIMEDVKLLIQRLDINSPSQSAQEPTSKPQNCQDMKQRGQTSNGLATIFIPQSSALFPPSPVTVYCDQTTTEGGWVLLLRRVENREENFPKRSWEDYKAGFGNPTDSSYWLGLETVHQLTRDRHATLRVELEDFDGETRYAEYAYFRLDSEVFGYRLYVDAYSGDAGDGLIYHNGQRFSTQDNDQDTHNDHCAQLFNGAWWYKHCVVSCLTGEYLRGEHSGKDHQGVYWRYWRGPNYSYKRAEMKIRFASVP